MNLLVQLLPYTVLAWVALVGTGLYVTRASQRRLVQRAQKRRPEPTPSKAPSTPVPSAPVPTRSFATPRPTAAPSPATLTRTQILRLHEGGIEGRQIASALQIPLEEVDLVVSLNRARESLSARPENPQPTIVE